MKYLFTPFSILTLNIVIIMIKNGHTFNSLARFKIETRHAHTDKPKPFCDEDKLMMYLAEIQAINPESIINLSTLEGLSVLCNKVSQSLNRMDVYMKSCEPPNQKDLYMQLIKGVNSLYEKLCEEGDFKKHFQKHYDCLHELRNDFLDCSGPADWTEDAEDSKICKAYQSIADCYYVKAAKLCGIEAATILKELILAVIDSVITINCSDVKDNPIVSDPMPIPVEASAKAEAHVAMIINWLMPLTLHIFYNY